MNSYHPNQLISSIKIPENPINSWFPTWSPRYPRMACLHPWARRPSPPWRAWVNCGPILCLAWRIISLHGIHGIYWDIYIYIWIYHEYQWWYIMNILMVHDGNWLLIIIFIFRMGNPLLSESLLGILLFFWEVLKQIQVRAWFLLPAVSNQNLELFHILGWWTQKNSYLCGVC